MVICNNVDRPANSAGLASGTDANAEASLIWHYTPYFEKILEDGVIRFALSVTPKAPPAVWFSSNQLWEKTVQKFSKRSADIGLKEHTAKGVGRIGISRKGAYPWQVARVRQKLSRKQQKGLAELGRMWGAKPTQWFMVEHEVTSSEWLATQVYADSRWVDYITELHSDLFLFAYRQRAIPIATSTGGVIQCTREPKCRSSERALHASPRSRVAN